MKRSSWIAVSLATASLAMTGCGRKPPSNHSQIIPLDQLPQNVRATIPNYTPSSDVSSSDAPLNAYDPDLGYFHKPCSQWYPYPYDYYDSRWGYYRCGQWSRYNSTRSHYHSQNGLRFLGSNSGSLLRPAVEMAGAVMAGGGNTSGTSGSFRNPNSPLGGSTPPPMPGPGGNLTPPPMPGGSSTPPPLPDYATQPAGAPKYNPVSHSAATATKSRAVSSRGGFGSSGSSVSSSSSSRGSGS
jgi:hypothetical protein